MVDFGVKHVHNRDRELGDYKSGEFRRVIVAAVNALLELGRRDTDAGCEHDTDRGLMILNEPIAPRRQHRQKYHPAYQMHRRRRAA